MHIYAEFMLSAPEVLHITRSFTLHNHPSGNPEPSSEDYEITKRLNDGADILGIRFLDHVIIGDGAYVSFADRGRIETSTSNWPTIIRT